MLFIIFAQLFIFSRQSISAGIYATDFYYYHPNTTDKNETIDNVILYHWYGKHNKSVDIVAAQPFITRLEFPADGVEKSFPPKGEYWLRDDTTYVVIQGNCTFGSSTLEYGYGDVLWVMGGVKHGPIINIGNGTLWIQVLGMDYDPQFTQSPSDDNPSVDKSLTQSRSYRRADSSWRKNPSHHSQACLEAGGVYNMNFKPESNTPPILRVKWAPGCKIPYHYHPTGALYIITLGQMYFKGDLTYDQAFNLGDARWARPGWAYGPEYTQLQHSEITVLGTDTPPTFDDPPAGPYKVQRALHFTHIYDNHNELLVSYQTYIFQFNINTEINIPIILNK